MDLLLKQHETERNNQQITEQIASLAAQIIAITHDECAPNRGFRSALEAAEDLYRWRRQRQNWFDADLFQDPAWDMLLDLFIARERGRNVYLSSACIASCSPSSTAMRWLTMLESKKLVTRTVDPGDRRRIYVALTPAGHARLSGYLLGLKL